MADGSGALDQLDQPVLPREDPDDALVVVDGCPCGGSDAMETGRPARLEGPLQIRHLVAEVKQLHAVP